MPDLEPVPGVVQWQPTATAWLQVVTDPACAGRSAVRFGVDELDATAPWLRDNGVTVTEPQVIADIVAVVDAADPDGDDVSSVAELAGICRVATRDDPWWY